MRFLAPAHVIVLQKSWQAFSGLVTTLLITQFLSSEEQGYFYTFGSLLSGYVLLDLGLSGLLVQITARMYPGVVLGEQGRIATEDKVGHLFAAMTAWVKAWYFKVAALSLLLIPLGYLYFSHAALGAQEISWQWPWVVVVLAVAISLPSYPALSIIEGMGRIVEAYSIRLGFYVVGAVLTWVLVISGHGLLAPAMAPVAVAGVTFWWFRFKYRHLFSSCESKSGGIFSWREMIWPLHQKVALTWITNYAFLFAPTIIIFFFQGPKLAGQMGLSIVMANILGSICTSWFTAKVPHITHLVVEGRVRESDHIFIGEFKKALVLGVAGYGAILAGGMIVSSFAIGQRILPLPLLGLLLLNFQIVQVGTMLSIYFRARGRELLAIPNFITGFCALVCACIMAKDYGAWGVLGSWLAGNMLIYVPSMRLAWKHGKIASGSHV